MDPARTPVRLTIVDDDQLDRLNLKRLISKAEAHFFVVAEADSVESGVRAVTQAPPDCLVLDFHLPDGTATDVLARLRTERGRLLCPVVVLTGSEQPENARQALRAGAQDFIGKRWMTPDSLSHAIHNACERWKMEGELHDSEERFRLLAASVPEAVWVVDADGKPLYSNERFRMSLHGLRTRRAEGEWRHLFQHAEADEALERLRLLREKGEPFQVDLRLRSADGRYRWHQVHAVPAKDKSGRVTKWFGVNTDIHDRRESQEKLTLALEAAQTGIWTWDLDSNAVTLTPQCHRIFGTWEETFTPTLAAFLALILPVDRDGALEAMRSAIANNQFYSHEFRALRADGEVIWVRNLGRASYDEDGRPRRMLGTLVDVSIRKHNESLLRSQEHELRLLSDSSPNVISKFDRELRVVSISKAIERLTGISSQTLLGKTNREMGLDEASAARWDVEARAVFATSETRTMELAYAFGGQPRWYEFTLVPDNETDPPQYIFSVSHDVTDRKRSEEELRRALDVAKSAVRSRDDLLSLVSHDLKSPLNSLALGIEILEEQPGGIEPKLLARMARQARRMENLISELLDAAQLHAGKPLELDLKPTDLAALARAVAADYQGASPKHQFDVVALPASLLGHWDGKRLERVVSNLVSNAIKYSPSGGTVGLRLDVFPEGPEDWVVLAVRDQGIGVPAHELDRIFGWYTRGANARAKDIAGTGIGLAAARDIVQLHGGQISVESHEGQGSTFRVRIPRRSRAA